MVAQETHLLGLPVADRPLRPASMLLFYAFLIGMSDPARKLSGITITLQHASAASRRIGRFLEKAPRIADPRHPAAAPPKDGSLRFEAVRFGYGRGQPVLQDIDLLVPSGETLAIVGDNGSGKSTLLDLVLRFHDPHHGTVRIGGVDLREFRLRDLRRRIGLVAQTTTLFDDTVLQNIWRARPSASRQEVEEAAALAGVDRFVRAELADGYETVVGTDGVALSGGQAQKVAVARALLRDPMILLLDEASSHLDGAAEAELVDVLRPFLAGRTGLVVTHRPALLDLATRIAVMQDGRILDLGSHAELIARCPAYERLRQAAPRA